MKLEKPNSELRITPEQNDSTSTFNIFNYERNALIMKYLFFVWLTIIVGLVIIGGIVINKGLSCVQKEKLLLMYEIKKDVGCFWSLSFGLQCVTTLREVINNNPANEKIYKIELYE